MRVNFHKGYMYLDPEEPDFGGDIEIRNSDNIYTIFISPYYPSLDPPPPGYIHIQNAYIMDY